LTSAVKSTLKIILPLLLGGFLVWYSLRKISFSELAAYFINANYFWISLGVFLGILSHLSRAYRWKYLLEPMGYSLRFSNSIMAVFSGYLINYTIPRAGEVSRATILTNYEGVPFEKSFGTIFAERVADIFVMLLIIGFTLIWKFDIIYDFLIDSLGSKNQLLIVFPIVLFISYFSYKIFKNSNHHLILSIKSFLTGFFEGIMSIFKMKHKKAFIAHTCFIWAMYILMFYVTSFSIESISQLHFSVILIGFIAASFSVAATNGGIGAYPLAVYAAFSFFNIEEVPSLAFGWIMWSSHTVMIIVMGGLSLVFLPIYNRFFPKYN
tara:strand:+ start:185 stop:1153 length:969 start_codon:yes stop_codon:yes gene_type:complete